jgi:type VI secretion system protein ImpL
VRVRENTDLPAPRDGIASAVATAAELSGVAHNGAKQSTEQLRVLGDKGSTLSQSALQAGAKALADATAPKSVTRLAEAFRGLTTFGAAAAGGTAKLEQYQQLLQPVLLAVKAVRQDESQVGQLATTARAALESTELLLRSEAGAFRENLRGLLVPVLSGIVELSERGRGGQMARAYCDAVYASFQRDLAGRFPFDPRSSEPASLAAFTRFFQPGSGSLWSYQTSHLASYVSTEGGHFRFKGAEARALVRVEVLEFLQRAAAVSHAFFPDGATSPTMPLRVRVRGAPGYTLTSLRVGTRTLQYDSGQETWASLSWPGEPSRPGASLAVTPYQGEGPRPLSFDNPWGLFMMLSPQAGAQLFERTNQQLSVGWRPKGSQNYVKVDFASDDPRSPLWALPFTRNGRLFPLSAPARISPLHAACGGAARDSQ